MKLFRNRIIEKQVVSEALTTTYEPDLRRIDAVDRTPLDLKVTQITLPSAYRCSPDLLTRVNQINP